MKTGGSTSFMVSTAPSPNFLIKQDGENDKIGSLSIFLHCYAIEGTIDKNQNVNPRELEKL